jgi:O-antigen/teichoic acid export membrane protein
MTQSSAFKNIVKNAGILLSGNVAANILGLLSLSIFTHTLGATQFGYYALFLTYLEIIGKLFGFQSWQGFIKYGADFKEKKERNNFLMLLKYSFLIDLCTSLFAFVIALSFSAMMLSFFEIPSEYSSSIMAMTCIVAFQAIEVTTGIFRVYDKFKIQAKIAVYVSAIKLVFFGFVALFAPTFESFIVATVIAQLVATMLKFYFAKQLIAEDCIKITDVIRVKIDFNLFKEIKYLSFIVYNNFSWSVRMVSRQFDIVVLGRLFGAEVVGLYKIAKEVANIIAKLTDPIYQTIYPEFARMLSKGEKLETKRVAIKVATITAASGCVFFLGFVVLGKWAVGLAFGNEFLGAYSITLVYFLAVFIAMVSLPLAPLLLANGLAKEAFYNQLHATIGYVIVLYPLTFYYAAIGTSLAYVVFYLLWIAFTIRTIKKFRVL